MHISVIAWTSAGRGRASLDFIHGTDIEDRGLVVLFFVLFLLFSVFFTLAPLEKTYQCYFSAFFCYVSVFLPLPPLEIFLPTPIDDR